MKYNKLNRIELAKKAVAKAGSQKELALYFGRRPQAIGYWVKCGVPHKHLEAVCKYINDPRDVPDMIFLEGGY